MAKSTKTAGPLIQMKPDISIGIIPLRTIDGAWEVLLVQHREAGFWGFPKGHPELGEELKKCAERELVEETGFRVDRFLPHEPLRESYSMFRGEQKIEKENYFFLAEVKGQLTLDQNELADAKWLSLHDAATQIGYPAGRALCLRIQNILDIAL